MVLAPGRALTPCLHCRGPVLPCNRALFYQNGWQYGPMQHIASPARHPGAHVSDHPYIAELIHAFYDHMTFKGFYTWHHHDEWLAARNATLGYSHQSPPVSAPFHHSPTYHDPDAPHNLPGEPTDPYPMDYCALRHDPARGQYTHHMAGIWANPPPPAIAHYHYDPASLESPYIGASSF